MLLPLTQVFVKGMAIHGTLCGKGSTKHNHLKSDCSSRINNESRLPNWKAYAKNLVFKNFNVLPVEGDLRHVLRQ
jgi:hypothetical protein